MSAASFGEYVLITPARNEAHFLAGVIEAVAAQTILPKQWIIIDDRSTDGTADVVRSYLTALPFLHLLRIHGDGSRHFGRKAAAFNAAVESLHEPNHSFIGNLDADIILPPSYYETILREFQKDPQLGLAGGRVFTRAGHRSVWLDAASDSVPGAIQLFRRECFEAIGGRYLPLEWGGIDAAAEITARMRGWAVRQFPVVTAYEQRRMGTADAGSLAAKFKEGLRFHSLGYGTVFYFLRSVYKMRYRPWVIGSMVALAGFLVARLRRYPVTLPSDVVQYLRMEQRRKLLSPASALRRPRLSAQVAQNIR